VDANFPHVMKFYESNDSTKFALISRLNFVKPDDFDL